MLPAFQPILRLTLYPLTVNLLTMDENIAKVASLRDGETCYINWFQEGGGEVTRIGSLLHLVEIPEFGGEGRNRLFLDLTHL